MGKSDKSIEEGKKSTEKNSKTARLVGFYNQGDTSKVYQTVSKSKAASIGLSEENRVEALLKTTPPGPARKRLFVLQEILQTETQYLEDLQTLNSIFRLPLQASLGGPRTLLSNSLFALLFSALPTIVETSNALLTTLRAATARSLLIGAVFSKFAPFFKVYQDFVNNFDEASAAHAEKKQSDKKYADFFEKAEALPTKKGGMVGPFLSHFVKPVQRVPRYRLLLAEALKYTPVGDPDKEPLAAALAKVEVTANQINEKMQENQNRRALLLLLGRFSSADISKLGSPAVRRLEKTGMLKKRSRKGSFVSYFFVLLSDCLVYALELAFGKLALHAVLPFNETVIVSDKLRGSQLEPNEFVVETSVKSFVVKAKDVEEKQEWVEAITVCVKKAKENSKRLTKKTVLNKAGEWAEKAVAEESKTEKGAPVWIEEGASNTCMVCGSEFGLFNRKHNCRKCGKLVCGDCSKKKTILEGWYKNKPVRVCSRCYYLVHNKETIVK